MASCASQLPARIPGLTIAHSNECTCPMYSISNSNKQYTCPMYIVPVNSCMYCFLEFVRRPTVPALFLLSLPTKIPLKDRNGVVTVLGTGTGLEGTRGGQQDSSVGRT